MNQLEHITHLLLSPLGLFIVLRFYDHAFEHQKEKAVPRWAKWMLIAVFFYLLFILRIPVMSPIVILVSFIFLPEYQKNPQKKLMLGFIASSVSVYWLLLLDVVTYLLPQPILSTAVTEFAYSICTVLLSYLGLFLLYELLRQIITKKSEVIAGSLGTLLLLIPLISFIAYVCTYLLAIMQSNSLRALLLPLSVAFIFTSVILLIIYERLVSLVQITRQNALLDQQLQMQGQYYIELDHAQKRLASVHHDMKNHLRTASHLAETSADNLALVNYLNHVVGHIEEIETVISTLNPNLDSILNLKIAELKQANIRVEVNIHIPSGLKITFEQSVVLFGNLLDNAREACLSLPCADRYVTLNLSYSNEALFIQIKNSAGSVDDWDDDLPVSSKNDRVFHGLGLKNVRKMVEENGAMKLKSGSNYFLVTIILYCL